MSENLDPLVENPMTLTSTWGLRVIGAIAPLIIGHGARRPTTRA